MVECVYVNIVIEHLKLALSSWKQSIVAKSIFKKNSSNF